MRRVLSASAFYLLRAKRERGSKCIFSIFLSSASVVRADLMICHLATGHTVRHLMRNTKNKSAEQLFIDWLARQTAGERSALSSQHSAPKAATDK